MKHFKIKGHKVVGCNDSFVYEVFGETVQDALLSLERTMPQFEVRNTFNLLFDSKPSYSAIHLATQQEYNLTVEVTDDDNE